MGRDANSRSRPACHHVAVTDSAPTAIRTRHDLCPGVSRPWPAEDGALVRIRLVGGEISLAGLRKLGRVAARYGDGDLHLTKRANVQLRGLPADGDRLEPEVAAALQATGLVGPVTHELVRNVMVSPLTGLHGGRADVRPVALVFDELLCADAELANLPAKFLVVLDDGRGDLVDHSVDIGAVAVDAGHAQLRAGSDGWGDVVPLDEVPHRLIALAHDFLRLRGEGPTAAWHVDELGLDKLDPRGELRGPRDPRTEVSTGPLPYGAFPSGIHVEVPDGVLSPGKLDVVLKIAVTERIVVTPWRGLVLPSR
jgi:precorrin-3B synthase